MTDFINPSGLLSKRKNTEKPLKWPRSKVSCIAQDDQFILQRKMFDDQYNSIYCERLNFLRTSVEEQAKNKWTNCPQPPTILGKSIDIKPSQNIILVGTLVKKIKLLPTILEQYAKERAIVPIPSDCNYFSSDDTIWLEDDSGRVLLKSSKQKKSSWDNLSYNIHKYSHGSVIGIKGTEYEGSIIVEDICVAGTPIQPTKPKVSVSEKLNTHENGRYVVLTSNLNEASPIYLQLMLNYIEGHLGSENEQENILKNIVRVIIAGNTFPQARKMKNQYGMKNKSSVNETEAKMEYINKLRDLDVDLANLSSIVNVDIMASSKDPTNYTIPHQPLNKCLVPLSSKFSSFNRVSSPHKCTIENTIILGTTGEEISNIKQFIPIEETNDVIEQLLQIRHMAPTAPDTLASYPSESADPFIIDICPHIYFVGNQSKYSSKLFHGENGQYTRIISVPNFKETSTIVMVNIDTLSCYPITFSTDL